MQQSAAAPEQHDAQRPRVVGRPWKSGQSGNPSGSRVLNQRIADLFNTLAADFGGEAALSAIDRALLMQSCVLLTRAQRTRDVDAAVRLTSEARRGLMALRRHAVAPREGPTLAEYLADKYGPPAADVATNAPDDEPAVYGAGEERLTSEAPTDNGDLSGPEGHPSEDVPGDAEDEDA
jgi:hypothetical protein